MQDWKDRKVLVLGLGDTGWSMTRWLSRHGARVRVADTRARPPHARRLKEEFPRTRLKTGPLERSTFARIDAIAVSPGIDRREPLIANAIKRGVPVVGDIEIFAQALHAMPAREMRGPTQIVAITGSNGKSTVTAMAGEIAGAAARNTLVAGNIGLPVLDALEQIEEKGTPPDVCVLELSSFQLESTSSLNPDAASVLNVSEDHLDRYDSLEAYASAKARIFEGTGIQVLNRQDAVTLGMARPGREVRTFGLDAPRGDTEWGVAERDGQPTLARGSEMLMPVAELSVTGLHNAANALAALALTDAIWLPTSPALEALHRFRGLPHRVEHIADIEGVAFYDDSKGTNVGATVAALNGMPKRVVLIAGGEGKGQDFSPLARPVEEHARAVVLIGRDAQLIADVLSGGRVPVVHAENMHDAVHTAYRLAREGDAVLLSPACASFDMFRSYVHRSEVFVDAVKKLAQAEEAGGRG